MGKDSVILFPGNEEPEDIYEMTLPQLQAHYAAMQEELALFQKAFEKEGLQEAFARVVGIVVQPGVEFGDDQVFLYDAEKAKELTACAKGFAGIAMEGTIVLRLVIDGEGAIAIVCHRELHCTGGCRCRSRHLYALGYRTDIVACTLATDIVGTITSRLESPLLGITTRRVGNGTT